MLHKVGRYHKSAIKYAYKNRDFIIVHPCCGFCSHPGYGLLNFGLWTHQSPATIPQTLAAQRAIGSELLRR